MSASLLIELRVEELPAGMCRVALAGLRDGVVALLEGVEHGAVRVFATPRRLAVAIDGVAGARASVETEVTGPAADKAFDADGRPTKVAEGFARGKGVDVSALYTVELPKRGAVIAARVREGGERTVDLLAAGLADVIARIPFGKTMTWGDGTGLAFGRPLRGVLVVFAGEVVAGEAHGLPFTGETVGHRLYPDPVAPIDGDTYLHALRSRFVEPDIDVRAGRIRSLLDEAASELGADRIDDPDLAEEVLWLVEWPVGVLGRFDAALLELPPRLLVTSMRVHQRYFPVHRAGALTEDFVVIGNNPDADPAVVAEGNARVLRARFHDARFFLAEDRRTGLAAYRERLGSMRWIRGLGTMADKGPRLGAIAARLAPLVGADEGAVAQGAAWCKADLTSQMVGEFPELQGHIGRLYAEGTPGIDPRAARAIEEHYLPRGQGDLLPASPEGAALALAERLDSLVGCFGIGLEPARGGDPQGLRRAANGVVSILLDRGVRAPVGSVVAQAVDAFADFVRDLGGAADPAFDKWIAARVDVEDLAGRLVRFLLARYRAAASDAGLGVDVCDAVLATAVEPAALDLVRIDAVVRALSARRGSEAFEALLQLAKRVSNITRDVAAGSAAPDAFPVGAERDLAAAADALGGALDRTLGAAVPDVEGAIDAVLAIRSQVATFFDDVLVQDPDDPAGTARRLALLARLRDTLGRLADFSRISTR